AQLRHLVSDGDDDDREAVRLLENILANAALSPKVRGGALELLRARHERRRQPSEVVRVLEAALAFADPGETIALHREIAQRLAILERLASIEPIATDRRSALGQAARLATSLGDTARAVALWSRRLEADATDPEALAGQIAIFEAEQRWPELALALRARVDRG